ncbi:MAG: hypothetical protein M3Y48_22180 [Actinomycetota bacterium]|nr:hypothetical protein [Actinomycetota bacterium]
MSDGSAPTHRGVVSGQVAEILVSLEGAAGRRGSGYRVGPSAALTAAHVVDGATSVGPAGWDLDEAETLVAQLSTLYQRATTLTWLAIGRLAGGGARPVR